MKHNFSRRGPDIVSEELAALLSTRTSFEFKPLFDLLHAKLRARNAISGGEEMLRLRAYEKLQFMVQQGMVVKTEKKYRGVKSGLTKFLAAAAENQALLASWKLAPPVVAPKVVSSRATAIPAKTANAKLPVPKAKAGPAKQSRERKKAVA